MLITVEGVIKVPQNMWVYWWCMVSQQLPPFVYVQTAPPDTLKSGASQ